MPHNKKYRGDSRRPFSPKGVSDSKLIDERDAIRKKEQLKNEKDRKRFVRSIAFKERIEPILRFDYSSNVFSMRGDWKTHVKVVKLFFPIIVNRNKCKKFEELVSKAFETIFLV